MNNRDVSVLIFHDKDKILLQKRSLTAKRFPGTWGLFGGGIEANEDPEAGLKREIKEELGVELNNVRLVYSLKYSLDSHNEKGNIFVFSSAYNNQSLCLNEGDEMKWVSIDGCLDFDLHPEYRRIVNYIVKNRNFMVF